VYEILVGGGIAYRRINQHLQVRPKHAHVLSDKGGAARAKGGAGLTMVIESKGFNSQYSTQAKNNVYNRGWLGTASPTS
jgi:hypothetical protein